MKTRFLGLICRNQGEGGSGEGAPDLTGTQKDLFDSLLNHVDGSDPTSGFDDFEDPNQKRGGAAELDDKPKEDKPEPAAEPTKTVPSEPALNTESTEIEPTQDDIIKGLQAEVMRLMDLVKIDPLNQQVQGNVNEPAQQTQTTQVQQTETDNNIVNQYLTPEELDRVLDEPGLINIALTRALTSVPQTMGSIIQMEVQKQLAVTKAVTDFYTLNDDLLPHAKYVQFIMAEQEMQHKDKTYSEIFDLTAKECRKRLGLKAPSIMDNKANNGSTEKPAFVKGGRTGGKVGQTQVFDENARDLFNLLD